MSAEAVVRSDEVENLARQSTNYQYAARLALPGVQSPEFDRNDRLERLRRIRVSILRTMSGRGFHDGHQRVYDLVRAWEAHHAAVRILESSVPPEEYLEAVVESRAQDAASDFAQQIDRASEIMQNDAHLLLLVGVVDETLPDFQVPRLADS